MLKIKLARVGKKKAPIYRIIISEAARDPYGRVLENLGTYNPKTKELQAKSERINYWLSQGAQMTTTVNNLLVINRVVKGEVIRVISQQPRQAEETKADPSSDSKLKESVIEDPVISDSGSGESELETKTATEEPTE